MAVRCQYVGNYCGGKRRPSLHVRNAFTLLEMLVVMGIIVLLLVALIPAVGPLSKSSGRKGAVNTVLGTIEQARAQAIKSGRPTYVVFPAQLPGSPTNALN